MVRALSAVGFACVVGLVEQGLALPHDHHDARNIYNVVSPKQRNGPAPRPGVRDKRAVGCTKKTTGILDVIDVPVTTTTSSSSWTFKSGVLEVIDIPVTSSTSTPQTNNALATSQPVRPRAVSESPSEPSPTLPAETALRHHRIQGTGRPRPTHSSHGFHYTRKTRSGPLPTGHAHGHGHGHSKPHVLTERREGAEGPSDSSPTLPIENADGDHPINFSPEFRRKRPAPTSIFWTFDKHPMPHAPREAEASRVFESPSESSPTLPEQTAHGTQDTAGPHPTDSSPSQASEEPRTTLPPDPEKIAAAHKMNKKDYVTDSLYDYKCRRQQTEKPTYHCTPS